MSELSSSRGHCVELGLSALGSGPLSGDTDPSTRGPHPSWQSRRYPQKVLPVWTPFEGGAAVHWDVGHKGGKARVVLAAFTVTLCSSAPSPLVEL